MSVSYGKNLNFYLLAKTKCLSQMSQNRSQLIKSARQVIDPNLVKILLSNKLKYNFFVRLFIFSRTNIQVRCLNGF